MLAGALGSQATLARRITAELITEISYGMVRDDEEGGHDFVQMHLDIAKITAATAEGYWVDYLPWSTSPRWGKGLCSPCGSWNTQASPVTLLVKHIPPWAPFAQWKKDAIKWKKQYNLTRDYMFDAVKKQLVRSNSGFISKMKILLTLTSCSNTA